MKHWYVTVRDKEQECVLSRAYPNFCRLVLIADEKLFTAEFGSIEDYIAAKEGEPKPVLVQSMNKKQNLRGLAVFREVK